MHVINGRNVCDNYATAVYQIQNGWGTPQSSRAGDVLVADRPVVTVTERPMERVLTDPGRDANPFFHFFECLWMLHGSKDATWLDQFVSDFSSRFAEDDGKQWGAYGYRWRFQFGQCQLDKAVTALSLNPLDRRVVITMWDPIADFLYAPDPVKDLPCNLQVIPRLRQISTRVKGTPDMSELALDITVTNRSNDVVWGCYGANAVHMSFLQEYLAGRLGCHVGTMYQMSNNWHAYIDTLDKVGKPTGENLYANDKIHSVPIGNKWDLWDMDLSHFMLDPFNDFSFQNGWFNSVALPMMTTHSLWKTGHKQGAIEAASKIEAPDWRYAAKSWMERRT